MLKKVIIILIILAVAVLVTVMTWWKLTAPPDPADFHDPARVTTEEMMLWIENIIAFGDRFPGTQGERRTRDFLLFTLVNLGISDVQLEDFPNPEWKPVEWSLAVIDEEGNETEIPCHWTTFSPSTPEDGVQAPVVYVGSGATIEGFDIAGKIVFYDQKMGKNPVGPLSRYMYDPGQTIDPRRLDTGVASLKHLSHIWDVCREKKPLAVVGLLIDFPYETDTFFMQPKPGGPRPPVPWVWVSRERSKKIRDGLKGLKIRSAKVSVKIKERPGKSHNIVAYLPGKTDRWFIAHTHFDSGFAGAVQDASGIASVLGLARHFGNPETKKLDHGIIFLITGAHMSGRIGCRVFFEQHPELVDKIDLDLTIEHIGVDCTDKGGADGLECSDLPAPRYFLTSFDIGLMRTIYSAIEYNDLTRAGIMPQKLLIRISEEKYGRGEAGESYALGIPSAGFISSPPYFMSREDTVDKVAEDELVKTVQTSITIFRMMD
jgi:hypothetical protein